MSIFDYSIEPKSDIAFIDMKSFYASVECISRGLHPLKTSLCVMSRSDNSAGLILASSPMFKKIFGKANVSRAYDLPFDIETRRFSKDFQNKNKHYLTDREIQFIEKWAKVTLIVPPRMDFYIEKNREIQQIFLNYASRDDIFPYSIDEGFIDLTSSLNYFIPDKTLSKKEKLDRVSSRIQSDIWKQTGLYSTIGMSNANPLLAKLALDNDAKKQANMRANWSYEDVEHKVWAIPKMTDFWGIGRRMEKRLNQLGIMTIKDLAHANPDQLKSSLGVIGVELFFHANGIDESNVHRPYHPKSQGIGNTQILPHDYYHQYDIELVFREMAEQVAIRLRKIHKKTTCISIFFSFSKYEVKKSVQAQMTIEPTNNSKQLEKLVISLFRKKYTGGAVRQIGVSYSKLMREDFHLISLFDNLEEEVKEENLQIAIDKIREEFGFTAILKANALSKASRTLARSKLVGGHSAGGLDGLQ